MDTAVRKQQTRAAANTCWLPLVLRLRPVVELTEEQFFELCALNPELQIERNAAGELEIMPPVGGETSDREAELGMQLRQWAKRDGTGTTFSSSGGFILPNGAERSPDASWVSKARLAALSPRQRQQFLPLCPEFVVELRSPSDRLTVLQAKLEEYIANGARLGWLIDPEARAVYIYRPDTPVERLENPVRLSGEPVLRGFTLELREIW